MTKSQLKKVRIGDKVWVASFVDGAYFAIVEEIEVTVGAIHTSWGTFPHESLFLDKDSADKRIQKWRLRQEIVDLKLEISCDMADIRHKERKLARKEVELETL